MEMSKQTEYAAADFGLTGNGDETAAFQKALDHLAEVVPATLALEKDRCYTVSGLTARNGVTIKGEDSTIENPADDQGDGSYVFTAGPGVDFTLTGVTVRAVRSLRGHGDGVIRLKEVRLQPVEEGSFRSSFTFADRSKLLAENSVADCISSSQDPATIRDQASIEWRGGEIMVELFRICDSGQGRFDLAAAADGSSRWRSGRLQLGRPSSGPLWEALVGTPSEFKQVLSNPLYAQQFADWEKRNLTQNGKVTLRIEGQAPPSNTAAPSVAVFGSYELEVTDSLLGCVSSFDQSTVNVRGGELRRIEAYGLSRSHYREVNLITHGSDDPWHPKTTYLQGNHCMEFSKQFNDLLPTVVFEGGQIDFAGDDCLNGLPEPRAMQLMEIVHDHASLFPGYQALVPFAPESLPPGTRLDQLHGQAGAVHNEDIEPVVPFDFRESEFVWKGEYAQSEPNQVGDVRAYQGELYVCNQANTGITPNAVFDSWQVFSVGFRNEQGFVQVARRVLRDGEWKWEKRQALGPWAGYTMRERGNPIVTYHVHLVLRNTKLIRRANTWSFSVGPAVPVGNSAYNYLLSCLVSGVHYNTECNLIECENVRLENIGTDALPAIRGLSLGPNRNLAARYVFRNVQITGQSIGAPVCFRVDSVPLRSDNQVVLSGITAEYNPDLDTATDRGEWKYMRGPGETVPEEERELKQVVPGNQFVQYEFIDGVPTEWPGIHDYLSRFIASDESQEFIAAHGIK